MKNYLSAYFFKRREDFSSLLKSPTFSNIIQRAKHGLDTFKLNAHLYLFIVSILFVPVILTNIHRCVNSSPDIKVLMKIIKTETFNVGFTSQ